MKRAGKRTLAWEKERDKLKTQFYSWGITECEVRYPGVCWRHNALGFAHIRKRRFLKPNELGEVCLACNPCHDILESLPHDLMEAEIKSVIAARKRNLKSKHSAFLASMKMLSGKLEDESKLAQK